MTTGLLASQLEAALGPGMVLPEAFRQLFSWIEGNGLYEDRVGVRYGFLFPQDTLRDGWTDTERPGGTTIEFFGECRTDIGLQLGSRAEAVVSRVSIFARTGADGSVAGFWLDDEGRQRIVHLGSGSGSLLTCVLAEEPVDFLRLLAIGYDELCWSEDFALPPNAGEPELLVHPNHGYQEWLIETFGGTIPVSAIDIVKHPAQMWDSGSPDPFCAWIEANAEAESGGEAG